MSKNTVFSQVLKLFPKHLFTACSNTYSTGRKHSQLTNWQHFKVLLFAQCRGLESLRDIQECFTHAIGHCRYHLGINSVARSTLSDANNHRDWRMYKDMFFRLLQHFETFRPKHSFRFKNNMYSLDSTIIILAQELSPWADYKRASNGIKIHTLFNYNGYLPEFLHVTPARRHDIDGLLDPRAGFPDLPKGSILVFDRAYSSVRCFRAMTANDIYFVTRSKKNVRYDVIRQREIPQRGSVISDQEIMLMADKSKSDKRQLLRLICFKDKKSNKTLRFITNNFKLAASTIAQCYKQRWQIETFFKFIKQNLKITHFYGNSENAVQIQIWTAMIYYVLLTLLQQCQKLKQSILEIHRLLCHSLIESIEIKDLFRPPKRRSAQSPGNPTLFAVF